jgi:hypothetical protein
VDWQSALAERLDKITRQTIKNILEIVVIET